MRTPSLKSKIDDLSEKLDDLTEKLDETQLRSLAVAAIKKHRQLLQCAEHAHQKWERAKSAALSDQCHLSKHEQTYLDALMCQQAQMMLVASLTDRLGYIPTINLTDAE